MQLLEQHIDDYVGQFTAPESEVLAELNRETHHKIMLPQMLSGHIQGQLLVMFSKMIQPKRVLEIGTYTGYSAICFAQGLAKDGVIHTIDINEELEDMVKEYVAKAGLTDQIIQHIGDATEIIPTIDEQFDLVFIDADKINYAKYYDQVFDKVKVGGYIIADNVLWSGKVTQEKKDKDTAALHAYNEKIHADDRVWNMLMPVRDGLMVAQKLKG